MKPLLLLGASCALLGTAAPAPDLLQPCFDGLTLGLELLETAWRAVSDPETWRRLAGVGAAGA